MTQLPKYKSTGLITAHAATGPATADITKYSVAWMSGLSFRNSPETSALCIYVAKQDPHFNGLHLAPDAARQLAQDILNENQNGATAIDIDNHKNHVVQVWKRFSASDAGALASRITAAMIGH